MAALSRATIQAPSKGVDTESAPGYIGTTEAPALKNFLPGRKGRIPVRGSLQDSEPYTLVGSGQYGWWFDNFLLLPGSAPILGTRIDVTPDTLNTDGSLNGAGPVQFGTTTSANQKTIFASHDRIGNLVYGPGDDRALATGTILAWDGTTSATALTARNTGGPGGPIAVKTHLDRLFVLAAGAGGGKNNKLYWSDIGGPVTNTAAVWQDDTSGLTNLIQLSTDDDGVGLARVGRSLCILRPNSLYLLSGDSPSTFAVRRVSSVGCTSAQSIVEYNDGVFFQSERGIEFFDGATVNTISGPIRTMYLAQPVTMSMLGDDFLMIAPGQAGVVATQRSMMYHIPTESWVEFSSAALANGGVPWWVGRSPKGQAAILDGTRIWNASRITRGVGEPGNSDLIKTGLDFKYSPATNYGIPAQFNSRIQRLGSPGESSQLHRAMVDYKLTGVGQETGATWTLYVLDDQGAVIAGPTSLPSKASPFRVRAQADAFAEALGGAYVGLQLAANDGLPLRAAEIHDVTLEYQTTRQRTG